MASLTAQQVWQTVPGVDFQHYISANGGAVVAYVDSSGIFHSSNSLISPPGNLYVVGNPNDTNLAYLQNKFGGITYADGSTMFQSTLQGAINSCVDLRGDVILVGPRTYVVTTPVLFNKKGITVSALYNFGGGQDNGERFTINADATPGIPAAIISEPCTISGLGFDSANTASAPYLGGTVQLGPGNGFDGGNYVTISNCRFDNFGHAVYGIDSQYNDYLKILNCDFDGTINGFGNSANVFAGGIALTQGHYVTVQGNTFRGCTYAIVHGTPNPASAAHSNTNFIYDSNYVISDTAAAVKFLNANNLATYTTQNGLVSNNWFMTATDTGTFSGTVAALLAVGIACSGNHYHE